MTNCSFDLDPHIFSVHEILSASETDWVLVRVFVLRGRVIQHESEKVVSGEFPGCLEAGIPGFHFCGPGSTPENLQAMGIVRKKKKKFLPYSLLRAQITQQTCYDY